MRLAQYLRALAAWPKRVDLPVRKAVEEAGEQMAREAGVKPDLTPTPSAFERALPILLEQEGGYVNHPRDPGGRTNLGVTQRVWESWIGRPATEMEMRRLTIDDVAPLYRKRYWDAISGDALPAGVALMVFDFGVNAGPARAARYLQIAVGAVPDGKIGPKTLAKVAAVPERELIAEYADDRRKYYRQLPTFGTFGRGWMRRVAHIEAEALKLAA